MYVKRPASRNPRSYVRVVPAFSLSDRLYCKQAEVSAYEGDRLSRFDCIHCARAGDTATTVDSLYTDVFKKHTHDISTKFLGLIALFCMEVRS